MNYNEKKQKAIETLCSEFAVTKTEMFSQSRERKKVYPRHLLALWIKENTSKSFKEIGKEIRTIPCDHTTAMNSVNAANDLIDTDDSIKAIYKKLPEKEKVKKVLNPYEIEIIALKSEIAILKDALASLAPNFTSLSYRSPINIAHSPQKLA